MFRSLFEIILDASENETSEMTFHHSDTPNKLNWKKTQRFFGLRNFKQKKQTRDWKHPTISTFQPLPGELKPQPRMAPSPVFSGTWRGDRKVRFVQCHFLGMRVWSQACVNRCLHFARFFFWKDVFVDGFKTRTVLSKEILVLIIISTKPPFWGA